MVNGFSALPLNQKPAKLDPSGSTVDLINQQLRQTLGKLELALDQIEDALAWTDDQGQIQWANLSLEKLLNKRRINLLGVSLRELLPLNQDGQGLSPMQHPVTIVLSGANAPWGSFYEYSSEQDGVIILEISASMISLPGGQKNAIFTIRNQTSPIKMTRQLLRKTEDLEKALERNKKIQEELTHQEKMATIGQLAGGLAHELNNPLGGILGTAQAILSDLKPGQTQLRKDAEVIERAALRCKKLISHLLGYSRNEPLSVALINPGEALSSSLSLLGHDLRLKNITVNNTVSADTALVWANKLDLEQIFINLISNAADAMKPKGGILDISSNQTDDHTVLISFKDHGCGIKPEIINKIFEPFFTTKNPGEGTGLGLTLCRRIASRFGGKITADSPGSGQGTTVSVILMTAPPQVK